MEFVALSTPVLIAIGLIVFGAATVKGVAGLGFPLITVPLVANIVGPHAAVVIIAVPTVASNLFMVAHGGGTVARLRQLAWLIAGLVAGAAVSARLLREINPAALGLILGVIAVSYAGAELVRVPLPLLCLPMLVGTWLGIRMRDRLSPDRFRTLVLVLVLLSGFNLIVRTLWR